MWREMGSPGSGALGGEEGRTAMQVGKPASLRMPSEDMVWEILRSGLGKSIGCFSSFRLSASRSMNTSVRSPPKKVGDGGRAIFEGTEACRVLAA